jgi:tetratricopeptide (TPR) repeat protein
MGERAMFRRVYFSCFVLAGALLTTSAIAADDLHMCIYESGEVSVEACNRAINSGRYQGIDLANAYINRGAEMIAKKEYDHAISDENIAIKMFPSGTLAYTNRGRAYQEKGDFKRALADFTIAIDHDRENPSAYNNRASLREQMGDRKGAIADLRRALASKPRKGKFVNAEADFKWARRNLDRLSKQP